MMRWLLALYCCAIGSVAAWPAGSEESNAPTAAVHFGGYIDVRQAHWTFNRDAADYQSAYAAAPQRQSLDRTRLMLRPTATIESRVWRIFSRAYLEQQHDQLANAHETRFDELFSAWTLGPLSSLRAGKIVLNWGRGYIWNPASFVERPKDPTDPREAREGYTMLTGDFSQQWTENTEITLMPVLLPVTAAVNDTFGKHDHLNIAGRFLVKHAQSEVAFQFLGSGSRSARHGGTFAHLLASGLSIYGEWARISSQQFHYATASGVPQQRQEAVSRYVVGAHLRTQTAVDYRLELYHNGAGYSEAEFSDYARLAAQGTIEGPGSPLLNQAVRLYQGGFGSQHAMRNYLYARVSSGSYADRGRLVPSLRATVNLDDHSHAITPEIFYNPYGRWSIRGRVTYQGGGTNTEYGEKRTRTRTEIRLHYHF